jgi:hypothetical protein
MNGSLKQKEFKKISYFKSTILFLPLQRSHYKRISFQNRSTAFLKVDPIKTSNGYGWLSWNAFTQCIFAGQLYQSTDC